MQDAETQAAFDDLIEKMYQSVSGPKGAPDWRHEREIFHPDARLMRVMPQADGASRLKIMTIDQYMEDVTPFLSERDFYEVEIARRTEVFGDTATILSAYEYRFSPDGPTEKRGLNSIQLYREEGRWRIISMIWDNEREGVALPAGLGG